MDTRRCARPTFRCMIAAVAATAVAVLSVAGNGAGLTSAPPSVSRQAWAAPMVTATASPLPPIDPTPYGRPMPRRAGGTSYDSSHSSIGGSLSEERRPRGAFRSGKRRAQLFEALVSPAVKRSDTVPVKGHLVRASAV